MVEWIEGEIFLVVDLKYISEFSFMFYGIEVWPFYCMKLKLGKVGE